MTVEGIRYSGTNPPYAQMHKRRDVIQNKKDKTPIERKIGIGALGTFAVLYLCAAGTRYLGRKISPIKLQKPLSEIFRRDISVNEVKQMQEKYAEIMKINDAEEFTRKAFEQIKKNYGYENADLNLKINYKGKRSILDDLKSMIKKEKIIAGSHDPINLSTSINLYCNKGDNIKYCKLQVIDTLFHELKHLQQSHICYQGNKQKYFDILHYRNILRVPYHQTEDFYKKLENNYSKVFKNVPAQNIKVSRETVNKYIESMKNHRKNLPLKNTKNNLLKLRLIKLVILLKK